MKLREHRSDLQRKPRLPCRIRGDRRRERHNRLAVLGSRSEAHGPTCDAEQQPQELAQPFRVRLELRIEPAELRLDAGLRRDVGEQRAERDRRRANLDHAAREREQGDDVVERRLEPACRLEDARQRFAERRVVAPRVKQLGEAANRRQRRP